MEVAVKVIDKAGVDDLADVEREISILSQIAHAGVLRLLEVSDEAERFCLVTERMYGGDLFDRIVEKGSFSERDAARVMQQLCAALAHLHERHICHRDVKADNLLLTDRSDSLVIRIADFGVARRCADDERMFTACGTPFYVAPEVVVGDGYTGGASDCWSAGVILYMMLCGFPPFMEEDLTLLFALIMAGAYEFSSDSWDAITGAAKDAVRQLLVVSPSERMTAVQCLDCPWVAGADAASQARHEVAHELDKLRRLRAAGHKVVTLQRAGLLLKSSSAAGGASG